MSSSVKATVTRAGPAAQGANRTMNVPGPLRIAAILLWISALGFGVFCLPAIRNLLTGRPIPYVLGFPAYGEGPFERVGIPTSVPLLAAFLLVCLLEGVAGWLLWHGSKTGAILALMLLPWGALFWWGFALPIPPIFALVRSVLIGLHWHSLKSTRGRTPPARSRPVDRPPGQRPQEAAGGVARGPERRGDPDAAGAGLGAGPQGRGESGIAGGGDHGE